jgi:hypothetical protein
MERGSHAAIQEGLNSSKHDDSVQASMAGKTQRLDGLGKDGVMTLTKWAWLFTIVNLVIVAFYIWAQIVAH